MALNGHTGRQRLMILGLLALPLAVAGGIWAGAAQGAGAAAPSMEVLPKTTGLKYGQTVEIKGANLPKGSGSVAATICGLQDATGKTIANPGANDCAGRIRDRQARHREVVAVERDVRHAVQAADERSEVRHQHSLLRPRRTSARSS